MRKPIQLLLLFFILPAFSNLYAHESIKVALKDSLEQETASLNPMQTVRRIGQAFSSDLDKALMYAEIAIRKSLEAKDYVPLYHAYRGKGVILEEKGKLEQVSEEYNKALGAAQLAGDLDLSLMIYNDLAILNRKLGHYKIAKDYHLTTLEIARNRQDIENIEHSLHGLGYLYETIGDYTTAIDYYYESLAMAKEQNSKDGQVITLLNMAKVYQKSKNSALAEKTIQHSFDLAKEVGDSMRLATIQADYGEILTENKKYEKALEYLGNALIAFKKIKSDYHVGRTLILVADVYLKQNKFEIARDNLLYVMDLKASLSPFHLTQLYNKLGNLYYKLNDKKAAEQAYFQSQVLAEKNSFKDIAFDNQMGLFQIYEAEGNFEAALFHHKSAIAIRDSIFNEEKSNSIAELQFRYDVAKGEATIQSLKLEKSQFMFLSGVSTSTLLLVFLGIFLRFKIKNNRMLTAKNQAIASQNKQLKTAIEMQKEFAFIAAHDLKEPLRNIGSFSGLIQRKLNKDIPDETKEYLDYIIRNSKKMNNLLTALLEYSTISYQSASVDTVNLGDVTQEVIHHFEATIAEKNAEIVYGSTLPNLKINRLHLFQLLQNIISNALKFNEYKPYIRLKVEQGPQNIIIVIKDNGIGMEEAYADKVFKLFQQLHKNNHNQNPEMGIGVGVGLSICKNIVEKYQGDIWFKSKLGFGTTFYISLPT